MKCVIHNHLLGESKILYDLKLEIKRDKYRIFCCNPESAMYWSSRPTSHDNSIKDWNLQQYLHANSKKEYIHETNLTKNASTVKSQYKQKIMKIYNSWWTGSPGVYDMLPKCKLRWTSSNTILHLISRYLIHKNIGGDGGKYYRISIDVLYFLKNKFLKFT